MTAAPRPCATTAALLARMKPHQLEALRRVAKTRGAAFFRSPTAMIALRRARGRPT